MTTPLPRLRVDGATAAEVECIAAGLLPPDHPVTLALADPPEGGIASGTTVELADAEGVVVGRLTVRQVTTGTPSEVTGPVAATGLGTATDNPDLRRTAAAVRSAGSGAGTVPVVAVVAVDPPAPAALRAVAGRLPAGARLLLVAAGGGVRPDDAAHHRRVRAWRSLAAGAGADLVLAPLWPGAPASVRAAAARAYGAGTLVTTGDDERSAAEAAGLAAMDADLPPAPGEPGRGATVFLTGLSGSGKSTIAAALVRRLTERHGRTVTLLDGDVVRTHLSSELGFSAADRDRNIRRIGWVAAEITKHGGVAVCAPIAPYDATRRAVRALVEGQGGRGAFVLVHVATPLAECERRDRKGLYAKARAGLIAEFTGISDPYEEPADAELVIDTEHTSPESAAEHIVRHLDEVGRLSAS